MLEERKNVPDLNWNVGALFESPADETKVTPPAHINGVMQASTGFGLTYQRFSVGSEGFIKKINVADSGGSIDPTGTKIDFGYYAGVAYFLVPEKFQLAAQFGQILRKGVANDSWGLGIGFNWNLIQDFLKARGGYYTNQSFDRFGGHLESKHIFETGFEASF